MENVKNFERAESQIECGAKVRLSKENALAETAEEKYRMILENIPAAIFVFQDNSMKFYNKRGKGFLRQFAQDLPFVFPGLFSATKNRWLKGEADLGTELFRVRDKGGNDVWVEGDSVNIDWERRPACLVSLRDVTSQKKIEAELFETEKIKSIQLMAGEIAQDFNNLLTIIQANCQISIQDIKNGNPLKRTFESIEGACHRAADLTTALLTFSCHGQIHPKVADLNLLIKETQPILERTLGENFELVFELGENLGRVRANPEQIQRAILILAVNAREAMPNGGKLTIRTFNVDPNSRDEAVQAHKRTAPQIIISLSDPAEGMSSEIWERRFQHLEDNGIGPEFSVSRAYKLVQENGGHIGLSQDQARGLTFTIYLPGVDEHVREIKKKIDQGKNHCGPASILIVEDNDELRALIAGILRDQGYRVLQAPQAREAIEIIREEKENVYLLLTDVVLPGVDGFELARHAVRLRPGLKVLYMSGYVEKKCDDEMHFLLKPFSLQELFEKVRRALNIKSCEDKGFVSLHYTYL